MNRHSAQWTSVRLGDVILMSNGQVDPREDPYIDYPHVGPENIESETGRLSRVVSARELQLVSGKYSFDENAIVYCKIRPNLNKVCVPGFQGICSADAYPIWARAERIDREYLLQYLRSPMFVEQATAVSMRTGMPKINRSDLQRLTIQFPPVIEQKAIATVLSTWDRAIEQTTASIAAKERLKQGLMQQLLTGTRRFPEFRNVQLQPTCLDDVLTKVANSVNVESGELYREIGIRSHGKGIFHKEPVDGKTLGKKRVFHVIPGCLTLNIVFAWERALAVTTESDLGMIASHRFPMFQPDPDRVVVEFVLHYMLSDVGHNVLKLASPGGAGRNRTISQEQFLKTKIPLPTIGEQRQIVEVMNVAEKEIGTLGRKLQSLKDQKRGLMQQLLTGRVRVPTSLLKKRAKE